MVAVFATFLASGILHEYVMLAATLAKRGQYSISYKPMVGNQLIFFAWNSLLLALEHALSGNRLLARFKKSVPKATITALVLLTNLPISHWFTDEWVACGFFTGVSEGFPRIVKI